MLDFIMSAQMRPAHVMKVDGPDHHARLRFDLYHQVHDPRRPLALAARRFFEMLQRALDDVVALRESAFAERRDPAVAPSPAA